MPRDHRSDPSLGAQRYRDMRAQVLREEQCCWLCGKAIDPKLRYPHPYSGSADHVVPRADGGDPFARSNLRAAHLRCNQSRGKRPPRRLVTSQDW